MRIERRPVSHEVVEAELAHSQATHQRGQVAVEVGWSDQRLLIAQAPSEKVTDPFVVRLERQVRDLAPLVEHCHPGGGAMPADDLRERGREERSRPTSAGADQGVPSGQIGAGELVGTHDRELQPLPFGPLPMCPFRFFPPQDPRSNRSGEPIT